MVPFIQFLRENYFARVGSVVVFINPSRSGIEELSRTVPVDHGEQTIRFIANAQDKSVIVWDAMKYLHGEMYDRLFDQGKVSSAYIVDIYNFYYGYGLVKGDHIVLVSTKVWLPPIQNTQRIWYTNQLKENAVSIKRFEFVGKYISDFNTENVYVRQSQKIRKILQEMK